MLAVKVSIVAVIICGTVMVFVAVLVHSFFRVLMSVVVLC